MRFFSMLWWTAGFSKMALLTLSPNCSVDDVSFMDVIEGDTQMISLIFPEPISDSLKILVNFESLTGICVLDWIVNDYIRINLTEIQCPSLDKLPLIDFNSKSLMSFSACGTSWGILNFYDPARSTTLN